MLVHAGDAARAASASSSPHRRTNAWGEAFNFDQINNSIAAVPKVEWEVAVEEQSKNNYRDVISTNYIDSAIENIKRVAAGGGAEEDSGGGGDNIYANYSPKNYRKQLAKDQEWAFRKRDSSYNDCYYEQQQHMNTNDYIEDRKWRRTVNEPVSSPPRDAADLLAESHSEYQQQSQKQQQEQQFTSWEKEREWIKSVARDLQGGKFDGRSDILSSQPVPPQQQQNLMAAVSTSKSSQGGAGSSSFNMDKLASILGMFETSLFTFHKLIDKIEEKEVRVKV